IKYMKFSKTGATLVSVVLLLAVASPIVENWKKKPKDSFPLSYYPMFAKKREAHYSEYHLVGYDSQKNRHVIPYKYVGTGGFNQVRRQVIKRCKSDEAEVLGKSVAKRLAASKDPRLRNLDRVEVVKATYHLENYFFNQQPDPVEEIVFASIPCTSNP
ncbi:MAG: hypothetical protein AAGI38_18930, partial [Bacteroidota bacterium]